MNARERVGRWGRSGGASPRVKAFHQESSRAVREKNVRVTQSITSSVTTHSLPRRKCPAAWSRLRVVPRAHCPYGRCLASVFTEMSEPSGSRSM